MKNKNKSFYQYCITMVYLFSKIFEKPKYKGNENIIIFSVGYFIN